MKNRQRLLARRAQGAIQDSDLNFVETDAPTPGEGEVLVRTLMLSCDPTQRGWIALDTYLPAVGAIPAGHALRPRHEASQCRHLH